MFIGMQHLQVGSLNLAKDYLMLAYDICKTDPLLIQELGALYYNMQE
jgi:anaphase-promoting complex subunit 6